MPKTIEDLMGQLGWQETAGYGAAQKIRTVVRTLGVPVRHESHGKVHRWVMDDEHADQLVSLLKTMPAPQSRNLTKKKEPAMPSRGPGKPAHPLDRREPPDGPYDADRIRPFDPTLPPAKTDPIGFKAPSQEFEVTLRKLLHILKLNPSLGIDGIDIDKTKDGWTANILRTVTVTKEEIFKG
jgi:hypothetical protein